MRIPSPLEDSQQELQNMSLPSKLDVRIQHFVLEKLPRKINIFMLNMFRKFSLNLSWQEWS